MRSPEENRIYMSKYMSEKYKENIELSRQKSRENYYRNKHSCYNQSIRISNLIEKLYNEIILLIENNEDCDKELNKVSSDLLELVYDIKKKQNHTS